MQVELFSNAVTQAEEAFFQVERPAFVAAVETAKEAVPEDAAIVGALDQAEQAFPGPRALELLTQAIKAVEELHHAAIPQPLMSPAYCYSFYVAHSDR